MTPIALDIAIGGFILISTMISYMRGIIKEFFTLAGLILSTYTSYKAGHLLVPQFNGWLGVAEDGSVAEKGELVMGILSPPLAAKVASYGGMFLLIFLVMVLISFFVSRWIKEAGLGIVDRLVGGLFGFLRGFLLVFLIFVPFTYLVSKEKLPDWAKDSFSVPILQSTLAWANESFELDKKIEDRGNGIAIKLDKIDLEKLGDAKENAKEELKEAVKKEEAEVQKAAPEDLPKPETTAEPPAPLP